MYPSWNRPTLKENKLVQSCRPRVCFNFHDSAFPKRTLNYSHLTKRKFYSILYILYSIELQRLEYVLKDTYVWQIPSTIDSKGETTQVTEHTVSQRCTIHSVLEASTAVWENSHLVYVPPQHTSPPAHRWCVYTDSIVSLSFSLSLSLPTVAGRATSAIH